MKKIFLFVLLSLSTLAWGQTIQTPFGKNRIQFHRQFDDWLHYESPNFITYWYGSSRNIGQATLQIAEFDLAEVQHLLEYPLTEKIEVIVFTDLTDFKQSNIGTDELFLSRTGQTKVVGNKIFTFFDGDHQHLRAQIREGIAAVLINAMLYGANLQEIVQNAVLLNLPKWFTEGLSAYAGESWSEHTDDRLRDILLSGKIKNFQQLAKEYPRLAGHAFWYYIGLHYGKSTISNLLYLTRINRSVELGFLHTLGAGFRRSGESIMEYFKKRYGDETQALKAPNKSQLLEFKNKKKLPVSQVRLSPDGQKLVFATNDLGKWRVVVYDFQTGRQKVVLRGGNRDALQATDYNYPLMAWSPDNLRLAIVYERHDVIRIKILELSQRKQQQRFQLPADYQRVYSVDFVNPVDLIFSAAQNGFSDLFLYHTLTNTSERLTQDFWDDLDATAVRLDNQPGILFASNRTNDTLAPRRLDTVLPIGQFDIFYFNLATRHPELIRITNTPQINERHPMAIDSAYFSYLSFESGIANRYSGFLQPYTAFYQKIFYMKDGAEIKACVPELGGEWSKERVTALLPPVDSIIVNLDSTQIDSFRVEPVLKRRPFTFCQTNFDRNLQAMHLATRTSTRKMVELFTRNGRNEILVSNFQVKDAITPRLSRFRELTLRDRGILLPETSNVSSASSVSSLTEKMDTLKPMQPGWMFQMPQRWQQKTAPKRKSDNQYDQLEDYQTIEMLRIQPDAVKIGPIVKPEVHEFKPSRIVPYRLKFKTDYFTTTMDNSLLFDGLDSYAGTPQPLNFQPAGLLTKANFKDLLEDYAVEIGARLPVTFNGAEYYAYFDNKKKRLDRRVALYRKTWVNEGEAAGSRVRNNILLGQYEVRYPLSHFFSWRATATLRQDLARPLGTDRASLEKPELAEQRIGLKLSAVYDNALQVDLNLLTGTRAKVWVEAVKRFEINSQPNLDVKFNAGWMTIVGVDARHYLRLDRRSVLAARLAGAISFGSERILYYLGGEENEIFSRFNNKIPVPQSGNFAFQALAPHLRGFIRNIRNGNSFALLNSELRVPIFKYFSRKTTMGSFWRNFQLIGFFDTGTAWQGKNPYSGENPLNTVYLDNPPTVKVKVNYFRDPLVAGYGVGTRMTLFGMFFRINYGWGIETRQVQPPVWHFSLGTDF